MKAYLVDEDTLAKMDRLQQELHGGTDRERDYGCRLWLMYMDINQPHNQVEVPDHQPRKS
jgi:hypothetical protein